MLPIYASIVNTQSPQYFTDLMANRHGKLLTLTPDAITSSVLSRTTHNGDL